MHVMVEQQATKKAVEFAEATDIPVPSFLSTQLSSSRPGYLRCCSLLSVEGFVVFHSP